MMSFELTDFCVDNLQNWLSPHLSNFSAPFISGLTDRPHKVTLIFDSILWRVHTTVIVVSFQPYMHGSYHAASVLQLLE